MPDRARALLRPALNCLIFAGLVLAAWPLGQNAYGRWNQAQLEKEFQREKATTRQAPARVARAIVPARPHNAATLVAGLDGKDDRPPTKSEAWPRTRILIPDIELKAHILGGLDAATLRRGPGHAPGSGVPGEGNCVIAGHRNTYGSPFLRLDELQPGAPITLETAQRKYHYMYLRSFTTSDLDLTVLKPPPPGSPALLTLITCTIPHTNDRIIVQAQYSGEEP